MKRLLAIILITVFAMSACAERGKPEMVDESPLRSITIRCAGDFVIHDNMLTSAKYLGTQPGAEDSYEFKPMLTEVAPYLAQADFTICNVDGVLGDESIVRKYGYSGYPAFSTPASLLNAIKGCGVDLLTLANNHALDYWYDGLKASVKTVEKYGFLHVGGYRTQEERNTPLVVDIGGIKVGFFNFTDSLNMQDKRAALDKDALKYGVCFTGYADDYKKEVRRLREAGAQVVVALMHWGIEYRSTPCQSQINKSRELAAAGVDVIIGGHPHNIQRAEWIGDTLCLYSLGNFLSDQRTKGRDCGIIFDFTLTEQSDGSVKVTSWSYVPTYVWRRAKQNGGYEYKVLISSGYLDSRPVGMSGADYSRMMESIGDIDLIMAG